MGTNSTITIKIEQLQQLIDKFDEMAKSTDKPATDISAVKSLVENLSKSSEEQIIRTERRGQARKESPTSIKGIEPATLLGKSIKDFEKDLTAASLSLEDFSKKVAVFDLETGPIKGGKVDFITQIGIIETTLGDIVKNNVAALEEAKRTIINIKPPFASEAEYEEVYAKAARKQNKPSIPHLKYEELIGPESKDVEVALKEAAKLIADKSLVIGHNIAGFDIKVLDEAFKKAGTNLDELNVQLEGYIDTLKESRQLYPKRAGHKLEDWGAQFEREEKASYKETAHSAIGDAERTLTLLNEFVNEYSKSRGDAVNSVLTKLDKMIDKLDALLSRKEEIPEVHTADIPDSIDSISVKPDPNINKLVNRLLTNPNSSVGELKSGLQTYFNPNVIAPTKESTQLDTATLWGPGIKATDKMNAVVDNLSKSLSKLQDNIVKAVESGLAGGGWQILESKSGEKKFELTEGGREWGLNLIDTNAITKALVAMTNDKDIVGPNTPTSKIVSLYKSQRQSEDLRIGGQSSEDMSKSVVAWLTKVDPRMLNEYTQPIKILSKMIKDMPDEKSKIDILQKRSPDELEGYYKETVLGDLIEEDIRKKFVKTIGIPAARVSSQGTVGFESKYGGERALSGFATITTGFERLAKEFKNLSGSDDIFMDMMHKIEQLPFRPEKGDVQSEKLAQSFWVDYIKPVSEFNKSGENIQREAYTGAIQYRRVERGELPGKVLQELSTLSLSDLENQFKSLNISYKELTDSLSRIDYSNFYDLLDAIYQSSGESSIQKAMKKMLGKEADSSIRELAKVKDELIGFMPTVSPGRPKRKPYDEESIKVLTRTITNAEGKAYLKPEDQKKHIIDTASTWQEEVRRANKLGKSSLYANLSPEMSKAMGIPEARPIDLSDASSAQLDEFNSNSTSKLKELNKTMTSANTSGLRGLAPFEKFGSIQRQLSYSANAISGGIIGGGEMALPSLRSKSEQGMIESGQYGTKGYGFNVLTELRSTAATFEDQILISGRLAEAFTKIVKPLIGPATNQEKGISEIQSGFKRRSSKGEKATAEDIGISKEDFEEAIKNVSKEYQNILGVPKKIPGRQDIAYLSKEVESLTRTHRGESIEVQSAKLTELFMNYFGRKFSTRFGTKGVSMTPKYGELPKGISSLEDVGKYIKSGFTGKIDLGSEGIGWSKVPKSMGELLSDMLEFKGDTELKDRLLESGNKFIVDLFKDVKQGFVGKDEAEKQKDLFADVTKKLAEHGDIFGEDLKDGLEGIAQITDRYKKMYSEKLLYTMQPIEARISARGVAKRGLMPEVLEGMVSNLVGTRRDVEGGKTRLNPASPTILEEGSYTTNRNINKKMNDYLEALSYSALSAEESGKVKERLEAEGAKPEQIESSMDFEKKWKVYSNVIDEFGEQIQSFVAPKFMQIIEEPHIYKSWSGEEIDRGIKGERLNYQAYAAYAGVFGKDSEMMKELSIASDIAASEGWELITALQALDPKLKDFTKSLTSGLKSVDVKDIESFIQGTASMSELKGTLLDIQKFPTAFNLKMPSTKTIGESEEFYIPGPSARQTYSETLMGGQVAPTKVSRDLTNLVEAAKKLQSNIALYMNPDISAEDKVGYEKTTALVKSELRSMLFDKGGKVDIFKAQERKNTIDTQEADDFIKQLKQGVSKTEKISTAFAPTGSKSGMTELETIEAWETSLKKENRKDYYAVLFGKISDILMGPKKEPIIEETTKLEKQLQRVQSGDTTVGKSASQLEAYIKRNNQKLEYTSSFDRATASSRSKFKDFAEGLGLDPSVSLKKEIEEQMESLSKAKANYANTLAESVLGPKQSIENTFFQRTVPGSVTAKAVTGIADKTDDFNRALGQLEDLGDTSFDSIISNLSEINKQHRDLIDKSRQLGIPVLKEGEIGLHPDLAAKMSTTDKGVKTNVKERLEQRKDTYISSVRYPFTGTLSVQAHASKLMTEDELGKNAALTKHAVVVPGAPQLDIAKLKTEVLTPLQDILNQKIQQRSDVWESGGPGAADAAGQLTNEINNLLKIIRDITPKYTNMEQKLDFDGDALFLHTGQVEKSRKEIQSQFEAMGKDLTSARSLFNTLFTAVKETDVKSLSEMAYQFSKKHPEEKGFKFLERSYSEKQVAGIKNIKDVLIALRADEVPKEKGESKTAYKERMQPFIEAYLKEKIFPVIESKTTGMYAPEEMEAFQQKAISGMGKIDATSEFEKVASKILNETARTQLEDKKYKDAITGQLYKLHTGQTVEGISRIARISERETGFGTGLAGTAGKIAKPSEEFLQKWPKESIALGEKPVEEFAARMNEVMRFVIQKGLDEKHAGVKSAGLDLIANVTKSSGAKKIIESMSSDASKFEELSQFNDQITREVQLRLGEHPTESLREELKRFSPEGISESQISNMGRKDLEKAIIGQVNLEAVFKELFKMIKRQAIEGLTQQTLESYKTNPRRKSQHMAAFGGSAEESAQKYAKQEIEQEAKTGGIKARKHIVSTMEPLYQLRTSTETPRSVGARASKKLKTEDITDLTFSNKENIQKYGGKYVNALNTSNVLSGAMESTFKNSGISAYSDMVESAAKKRMQELNQLEEEISKYHSITKELPMGVMGGGANTEAVPGLFADIWKDMEKRVFGDKGIPSKEDPKYAEKTMSGFSKVMELVRDRMGELSDKLAMPMISDEESFGAYTSFIEKHPTSLSNMNIEAKSAADALQVSLPDSENKTATIEATTEEYLKFMDDLLRFQTGMSDQALRITASMEAVDFQKSMLERAFPGVSKSIQSAIPDNITRALSEQEQSKTAEQTRITKEIFAKEIDKPTFTSKDKTVADVIRETSNIGKDVSGLAWPATGGFAPGSGAAAAAGGSGGGGGGDDDDELRKLMERLKAAIDEIERTSGKGTTTDKQLYDLMTVYQYIEKELRSINSDIPDFTDPKHPAKAATSVEGGTLLRRFKETVDKYGNVSSGFSGFESLEKSYDIYKAALEGGFNTQAGSSRGATDFSYLQDLDIETEHPDTMQGIHKNLKALFAVAKRRQSNLSSDTMKKFPQEVQDLLSQITEEGPNVEISGQLMDAVKKLPKEQRGFAIPIWKNYRKAISEYFLNELDRLDQEIQAASSESEKKSKFETYAQTVTKFRENIIKNLGRSTDIYTEPGLGRSREFVHPGLAKATGIYRTPEEINEISMENSRLSGEYQPLMDMLIGSTAPEQIDGMVAPIEKVRHAFETLTAGANDFKNVLKDPQLFNRPLAEEAARNWDFTEVLRGITQLRAGLESWNRLQSAGSGMVGPQAGYTENQRKNIEETIKLFKQLERTFIPTGAGDVSEMGMTGVPTFLSTDQQELLHKRNIVKAREYFSRPERGEGEVSGGPRRGEVFNYKYKIVDPATKQTIKNMTEEFKSLGDAVDGAGNRVGVFTQKTEDALKSFQERKGFGQAFGRVVRWGLASNLVYGSVSALKDMVSTISDVEMGVAQLRQVMNPLETNFEEVTQSALDFAKQFGLPIRQVIDSMKVFAQQGLKQNAVLDRTKVSSIAANVTTMDSRNATEALTSATSAFGSEGESAMKYLDAWTQVEARYAITSNDLANATKKSAATAKAAGVSFNQLNALVTGVGETTRQTGKEIGTSMNFIFRKISQGKGPKQLGSLGISTVTPQGDIRSAYSILDELAGKWDSLTDAQRMNIAQTIGGTRHYNSVLVLMDHWQRTNDALKDSINSKGAAERRNEIVMNTYAKKLAQVKAAMVELQSQFGKFALPIAKTGLTGMKFLIETITNIPTALKIAFVSLSSLFALFTKGAPLIDSFSKSFVGVSNVFSDFFSGAKTEFQKGIYEIFGRRIGGFSLDKILGINTKDPLELNTKFASLKTMGEVSGVRDLETGLGKSVYLMTELGRGWNNFLTDIAKGGASTTNKISNMLDFIGGGLVKGGIALGAKGGPVASIAGAITGALGTTSELGGYGMDKISKGLGLTSQQMAKLTDSSTGVVGSLAPMIGSFFALKPLIESSWDGFKKLAFSAQDYEKSIDALRGSHADELNNIKSLGSEYDSLDKKVSSLNQSMRPEVKSRNQAREEYTSPLHDMGNLYGEATDYGNKLSTTNLDLISGFDQFGNVLLRTTDNLKGYLSVLESAQQRKMVETESGVLGKYIQDLTKTTGMETFKNEFKTFLSEVPVVGELLAKSIKVSPAKSLEDLKGKMENLVALRNKYPLTTAFDIDLTKYNEKLAKARSEYKETYADFQRVLSDMPTEGLNTRQITDIFNKPEFKEGFELMVNIEPRLQTKALKGKVDWKDVLGTEVMKKVFTGKPLDFTAELTKGLLEQSNMPSRTSEAFAGDIVLFTEDISKKYEVAGNQAILKMKETSSGIVKWVVEFFDKELMTTREIDYNKVSKFVDSIFPVQSMSDKLYENVEALREVVTGAAAGLSGITEKSFKKDFNLGERFYSSIATTTLLQGSKGYEPGAGYGEVGFKKDWGQWMETNFFKPMTEYTQILSQLSNLDTPTGEVEMAPGLREDLTKLQDVLKNNQVVIQYRAVHEDLIKSLAEGGRILKENISAERNRNEYIVQSSGYLKGLSEDMSDVNMGVQKYTDLTVQQRLAFAEAGKGPYTTTRQQFKEGTIGRQSLVDSINNIDKALISVREIGEVSRSFGAAIPTADLSNYAEEIAKTGDRGTGLLLDETQKVSTNTADTVSRLDQLLEQGGDEATIERIISKLDSKGAIVNKLESLTEKRNKAFSKNDTDLVATYDRAIDKLTSKLVEKVGPEKALKAVKGNAPLFFGKQDYTQAEFIKRALGNTNFEGFSKALERVQPGITKTREFSKLIDLQDEQSTEQIVSNKNLNKILAVYSTMEHFNKVSSNRQIEALDTQIEELESQRRSAQTAGKPVDNLTTQIDSLTAQKSGLETKAQGQAMREFIAPMAIASQELAKAFGVTDQQMRIFGGGVGGMYVAWKAWSKLTGEPIPEYLKELGDKSAEAAERMSKGGFTGKSWQAYYAAKDLVFGKDLEEKLKKAEEKINSEKVLTDEEVNQAKERVIYGGEKAEDSIVGTAAGIMEERKSEKKESLLTSPIEDVTKLYNKIRSTLKGDDERLIDRIKKAMSNPEEFNKLKEDVLKVAGKKDIIDTNEPSPQDMLKVLGGKVTDEFKDILRKYGITAEEEMVIYGGEKAEDSEVRRPGKPESLGQAIRRAMEYTKAQSKAKSMSSEDKMLDENSAQTGILSGIYEQVKRTAENTTGFSENLSEEIKSGRDDRKDETDAIIANVDKIRSEYLAKQSPEVNPLKQVVAALLAATSTGYVGEKSAQRGRNNELENRAEDQVELLDKIIKKYPDSIAKAIEEFNTMVATASTPATTETETVQKAVDTESAEKDMVSRLEELRTRMVDEYDKVNTGLEESADRISKLQLAEEMKKQLDDLDIAIKSSQAIKDLEKKFGTPTSGLLSGVYTPQTNLGGTDIFGLSANESLSMGSEYEKPFVGKIKRTLDALSDIDVSRPIKKLFHKITFNIFKDTYSDMAKDYEAGTAELSKLMETASNITTEMTQIELSPRTDESDARYESLEDNLESVTDRMDELNESLMKTSVNLQHAITMEELRLRGLKSQADANAEFATNYAQSTTSLSPFSYLGKQGLGSGGLNLQMPSREEDMSIGERTLLEVRKSNNEEVKSALIGYSSLTSEISAQSQQSNELAQTIAKNYVAYDELSDRLGNTSAKAVALKNTIDDQVEAYSKLRTAMGDNVEKLKQFGLAITALNIGQLINDLSGIKRNYTNETQSRDFRELSSDIEKLLGGNHPMAQVMPTYAALKAGIPEDQLLNLNKYQLQKAELFSQEGPGPTLEQLNTVDVTKKFEVWAHEQGKQIEELRRQQGLSVESMTAVANAIKRAQERGDNPEEFTDLQSLLSDMQEAAKHMTEIETTTEDGVQMFKGFKGDTYKEKSSELIEKLGLGRFSDLANPITGSIETNTDKIVKAIEGQGVGGIIDRIGKFFGGGEKNIEGKATGGFITGIGGPREDRVLKRMSPGEYVLKASSTKNLVNKYGADTLHSINDTGDLPSFAKGGDIKEEEEKKKKERVLYPILRNKEEFAKRQSEAKAAKERSIEALKDYTGKDFIKSDKPKNSNDIPEGMVYDEDLGGLRKKVSISEIMNQVQSIIDTQEKRNKSIELVSKETAEREFVPTDTSLSAAFRSAGDKLKSVRDANAGKGFEYSKNNTFMENLSTTGKGIGSNLAVLGAGVLESIPRLGEWTSELVEGAYGLGKTAISKGTKLNTYKEGYRNIKDFWSQKGSLKEAASLTGQTGIGVVKGFGSMFTNVAKGDIKSAFDISSTIAPVGKAAGLGKVGTLGLSKSAVPLYAAPKYVSWADQLKGVGVRSGVKKTVTGVKDIFNKPMSEGFAPGVVDIMAGLTETAIGTGRIGKNILKTGLKTAGFGLAGVAGLGALGTYGAVKGGIGLGKSLFRGVKAAGSGIGDVVGDTFGNKGKVMSKLYKEVRNVSGAGPKKEIAKKWTNFYKDRASFEAKVETWYKAARSKLSPDELDDFATKLRAAREEVLTKPNIMDNAKTQFSNTKTKIGKMWSDTKESVKFGAKKAYYGYGKQDIPFLYRKAKTKMYDFKEFAKSKYTEAGGFGGIMDKASDTFNGGMGRFNRGLDNISDFINTRYGDSLRGAVGKGKDFVTGVADKGKKFAGTAFGKMAKYAGKKSLDYFTPFGSIRWMLNFIRKHPEFSSKVFNKGKKFASGIGGKFKNKWAEFKGGFDKGFYGRQSDKKSSYKNWEWEEDLRRKDSKAYDEYKKYQQSAKEGAKKSRSNQSEYDKSRMSGSDLRDALKKAKEQYGVNSKEYQDLFSKFTAKYSRGQGTFTTTNIGISKYADGGAVDRQDLIKEMEEFAEEYKDYDYVMPTDEKKEKSKGLFSSITDAITKVKDDVVGAKQALRDKQKELAKRHVASIKERRELLGLDPNTPFDKKYMGGMIQRFGDGGLFSTEDYKKTYAYFNSDDGEMPEWNSDIAAQLIDIIYEKNKDNLDSYYLASDLRKTSNWKDFYNKILDYSDISDKALSSMPHPIEKGTGYDFKGGIKAVSGKTRAEQLKGLYKGGMIQRFGDGTLVENEEYINGLMEKYNIKSDVEEPTNTKTSLKDRMFSLVGKGASKAKQLLTTDEAHDTSIFKTTDAISKRNDELSKTISKATGGGVDSVLAAVSPGEFIINRDSVRSIGQKYGINALDFMNNNGELPKFAKGGVVSNYQFADGGKIPYELSSASTMTQESIDPQKIGYEIGESISKKLESLEFKPVKLANDSVSISDDSIKDLENAISKINEGVNKGVGADIDASKIDAFIEATNSRLETFSIKIDEQDKSINVLSTSIDDTINFARDIQISASKNDAHIITDNLVSKEELDVLSIQADSKLGYKIHEAINFIEERYLVGFRTDISVLNGRISDLQYDLNDAKDRTDANISRLGLRS